VGTLCHTGYRARTTRTDSMMRSYSQQIIKTMMMIRTKRDVSIATVSIIQQKIVDTFTQKRQMINFESNISRRNQEKRSWMKWKRHKKNELKKMIKMTSKREFYQYASSWRSKRRKMINDIWTRSRSFTWFTISDYSSHSIWMLTTSSASKQLMTSK
jgi:hypothetical protein